MLAPISPFTIRRPDGPGQSEDAGNVAVRLARHRVTIAFVTVLAGASLVLIPSAIAGNGGRLLGAWPALAIAAGALPVALALLANRIFSAIEEVDRSRRQMIGLYDLARLDALLDPLTALGNHRAFQEELARQVEESRRYGRPLSLAVLDIDDLKRTNDELGHAGGDALIESVARLIQATVRGTDRAFRIGGDEFALLMPHTEGEDAHGLVRRLLAGALEGHPALRGVQQVSFSAGISSFPKPSVDGARLGRQADAALYWAKRHGRTDVQLFDPARHGTSGDPRSTPELATAVADVAARRALRAVYQPIFSLSTGRPIGFEGLVRPSEDSGFRDAESLFGAAEVAERTFELDAVALEVVIAGAGPFGPGQYLSVNISPRTLESEQFRVGRLLSILAERQLRPNQIVLELTERELTTDLARLRDNLAACRAAGFRIAADDVGAGNAGLRLLSELEFDIVKIDLSLVQRGAVRESSRAILGALHDLVERWHAITVAEGVETPEQLAAVRGLGMSAAQGYLLARPGPQMQADPIDLDVLAAPSDPARPAVAS